ncbi:MAG: winged helix-turn-helix domain-containing protein [Rhodanobacteraceae bacterium]
MASYRFRDYELIPDTRRLLHAGVDVAIGIRVFEVIAYLVQNRQRAVGRDELLSAVWGRIDGGDATLAQAVLKARRALGDDGEAQHCIRTVSRFGYQWVAPTIEGAASDVVASVATVLPTDNPRATAQQVHATPSRERTARTRDMQTSALRARTWIAALAASAIIVGAVVFATKQQRAQTPAEKMPVHEVAKGSVPSLILVTPAIVHSAAVDDGWMRLGMMSLSAQALAGVPGHAVVPDETALAAVAHVGANAGVEQLRAATGAAIVIASEANRVGEDWQLDATVFNADGSAQLVSARAGNPIAAAGNLAHSLRELLAPEGGGDTGDVVAPDVLALAAHMKSAILEAQNGRALAELAQAPASIARAPQIVLLQTEALTQLGKSGEAIDALRPLVDGAVAASTTPRWLPDAWTALGDSELARGNPAQAEAYFRRAIQLDAVANRRSLGLAWRGLGIAQIVRNDLEGAEQSYLRARLELEPVGDRLLLARVTDGLGYIATAHGRMADALMLYEQAASMGAAAGLNETELGSQLNAAQAHQSLLHHSVALQKLDALLPRIQALDYPALHRFGSIAYANALVETGAWSRARDELARLAATRDTATDAVVDVRLDEAQIDLALGDAPGAIALAQSLYREHDAQSAPDARLEAISALLTGYVLVGDQDAASALVADHSAWNTDNARAPARVHALIAQAAFAAERADAAGAIDRYQQALTLARDVATPLLLRETALPFANFQLAAGAVDAARATAGLVGPYAEDDFQIALLMARVAAATRDRDLARSYFAQAHRLAGERWNQPLADEEAAALATNAPAPHSPEPQSLAGG